MARSLLASIPSPPDNTIGIGPIELRAYGLMIALGVLAAIEMARRRFVARGLDPDDLSAIALWAVPAGLIGARLYHVATDWKRFQGDWWSAFAVWKGGLGIPGGMALGVLVGVVVARRRHVPLLDGLDAVTPALPLAQAVGRLGNWFNQELYGRPSDLPWALEIDRSHRPARYLDEPTFHPTFLYEALWNLGLVGFLLWLDRRRVVPRGRLFWVYVLGYGVGRLWVEALRSDPASEVLGLRINLWVSAVLILGGLLGLIWPQKDRADDGDGSGAVHGSSADASSRGRPGPRPGDPPELRSGGDEVGGGALGEVDDVQAE